MDLMELVGGAATGPIGIALGGVFGLFKKWGENRHEAKMLKIKTDEAAKDRQHELAVMSKEIEGETARAEMRLDESKFVADTAALSQASSSQDAEIGGLSKILERCSPWIITFLIGPAFAFVTFVQKMIRPTLTGVTVWMAWDIFTKVNKYVGGLQSMDQAELVQLYFIIIQTILTMASTSFMFWFVSRPPKTAKIT